MLNVNQIAPDFLLLDENSDKRSLSDYAGKWIVLYFYPKDDTPGCTKEACAITEVYKEFEKLSVVVIGVSKDSPASHTKFKKKYHLPFVLLSDESTEMIQKYGALLEKEINGKKYMGINRITYIINPEGKIAKVYSKVTPAEHAVQLLNDIKDNF